MKGLLHHIALNVCDIEWYISFFGKIFGMEIRKTAGKVPNRKVWFVEGIQLNECQDVPDTRGICDHISIAVPDIRTAVNAALKEGCAPLPNGEHWFALPNGMPVELMYTELPEK